MLLECSLRDWVKSELRNFVRPFEVQVFHEPIELIDCDTLNYSRETLTNYGNIASAVVLDAIRRAFEANLMCDNAKGIIAGFGPGITAEVCVGRWKHGSSQSCTEQVAD